MEGRDELSGAVYREVFGSVDDGLVLLDPDTGRIADVNDAFVSTVGTERGSLVGRRLVSVTNNDSHAAVAYAVAMVERAATGDPRSFEWTDHDSSGEGMELEIRFSPVTVEGTRFVLGVVRDVTAERERERALRRRKERLEEFAGVVSHDLRGPLNVVEGELDRHRETGTDEHPDAVEAASAHLDRVVTDLLDLARDGRTIGETEPTSLETAARRAWALVDERGATLDVTADLALRADPERLIRALENLFRNSVEHGSTGNRAEPDDAVEHGSTIDGAPAESLEVRVGALPGGEGFYVADSGAGLPRRCASGHSTPGSPPLSTGPGSGSPSSTASSRPTAGRSRPARARPAGARFAVRGVTTGTTAEIRDDQREPPNDNDPATRTP